MGVVGTETSDLLNGLDSKKGAFCSGGVIRKSVTCRDVPIQGLGNEVKRGSVASSGGGEELTIMNYSLFELINLGSTK